MTKTDYLENKLLDHHLRNTAYTPPSTVYMALFTAVASLETGSVTELPIANGYGRVAVTFAAASGGSSSNSVQVTFAVATGGNWGNLTHWGLYDAATGGNMLRGNPLAVPKTINVGDQLIFPIGNVICTED